jgi:hypothetical protein
MMVIDGLVLNSSQDKSDSVEQIEKEGEQTEDSRQQTEDSNQQTADSRQ